MQQVLVPYDPKSRRLRVDKNICLRMYCRDQASGEHYIESPVYNYADEMSVNYTQARAVQYIHVYIEEQFFMILGICIFTCSTIS